MMRTAGTVGVLTAFVVWLVLSYWPAAAAALPMVAFPAASWLAVLAGAALATMAALQVWVIFATVRPLRKPGDVAQAATVHQFNLNVGVEALLTAAPLLMTVALAAFILLSVK